jgi:type I restriction enzyme, S subunit
MSWPKVKLGDCCEVVSGATPKTGNPDYWGGEIPWVSPKSLSKLETKFLDEPTEYITQAGFDSCSTRMLPAMSLLLSCRAPVGLTAINREPICTNQGFKSLVPNPEIIDVNYLFHIMRKMRPVLEAKGRGATFTEVSKAIVERFEIPLPPLNVNKSESQPFSTRQMKSSKHPIKLKISGDNLAMQFFLISLATQC